MHVNNIKLFSKRLIAFIFIVFFPIKSWAQLMISPPQEIVRNRIFISTSLEPEWVATLGYTYLVGKPGKTVDLHLGGSFKFVPTIVADGTWRANVITAADWRMGKQWGTTLASNIYWAHDHNRAGVMQGLGLNSGLLPPIMAKNGSKVSTWAGNILPLPISNILPKPEIHLMNVIRTMQMELDFPKMVGTEARPTGSGWEWPEPEN